MTKRPLSDMPKEEFQAIIDAYLVRESSDMGEIDAPLFYEGLREMVVADLAAEKLEVEVEGEIVDNQLVLDLPADWEPEVDMRDISILFGERRIAVRLKDSSAYPTAH